MIRLFTAAALATLLASPVLAQSVSPSDPSGSPSQSQGSPSAPGSSDSLSRDPGSASQIPTDCTPNDARPECQTAQMPGQEAPDRSIPEQGGAGVMTPPAERSEPQAPGGQGGYGGTGR